MTSFVRLHHVWVEALVHLVVKLLGRTWCHVVIDIVVVAILRHRVPRWMRKRADVVAVVVDV